MAVDSMKPGHNSIVQRKEVVPWAQTGKVRYARWDGGPIESAKAVLSGWYYIKGPKALEATTNWYFGSNSLELLLAAGINWIWVTFSVGFSLESEQSTREQLRNFVGRCHNHGIHVTAYMSMDNLFIEDMRRNAPDVDKWLQRDRNGHPIPYGAARYEGEPTRLLACLNRPEWRSYLSKRVEMVLDDGYDGFEYDNQWTECRCRLCTQKWENFQKAYIASALPWPEDPAVQGLTQAERSKLACIYDCFRNSEYAEIYGFVKEISSARRPDILVYGNFNTGYNTYTFPTNNAVSTEDGFEPGIVNGRLVHNIGYLRCLSGAGAGWKPARIEYARGRGRGRLAGKIDEAGVGATRFVAMEPVKHRLSMAEAFSHGVSLQITPEGEFLRDLYFRVPDAMENWKGISRYNRFFAAQEELYTDTISAAGIVSLHNSCFRRISAGGSAQRPALIGELSRRRVILDVKYDRDIDYESLKDYNVMLLADMCVISGNLNTIIRKFAERGGRIVATGLTGWYDERFNRLDENALDGVPNICWLQEPSKRISAGQESSKQTNVMDQFPVDADEDLDLKLVEELAETLLSLTASPVKIECPDYVMYNLTWDKNGRLLIHFLNYDEGKKPAVTVHFDDNVDSVEWFSPDEGCRQVDWSGSNTVCLKDIICYGVLRCRFKSKKRDEI